MKKWLEHKPYKHKITYWIMAAWFFCMAVLFFALAVSAKDNLAVYLVLVLLWIAAAVRELYYCKKDCCPPPS